MDKLKNDEQSLVLLFCDLAMCVQITFLPTEGVFLAQILIATCECSAVRDPEKSLLIPWGRLVMVYSLRTASVHSVLLCARDWM